MNISMVRSFGLAVCVFMSMVIAGCATPGPATSNDALPFDEAVAVATERLLVQTQKMPLFLAKLNRRGLVIDPMLDGTSGQQTVVTSTAEQRAVEQIKTKFEQFELLPFQPDSLRKADYLMTGTLTRGSDGPSADRSAYRINFALIELKTGLVAAQASALARDDNLDTNPTPYYRDSPVSVKDKVVDGYIRSSETAPGKPADPAYFQGVVIAPLVSEATEAYNSERYEDALALYSNASATAAGEQLRVLNGIYLASLKLGHAAEAEQAFGKVISYGLANNSLGIKFLFNPGSTDFWPDPKVSGPYGFWLRQIAQQAATTSVCLNVIGHTSRTGSEQYNDRLSLQRAAYIKQRIDADAPQLARRSRVLGMGFRENLVGTGTDDARDALDRRVEFKIGNC